MGGISNMCIIASIPKNTGTITKNTLETMCNNNSHGFGIAWIDENNKIQISKSMDQKQFVKKCLKVQNDYGKKSDILIHARIATSGKTNIANCHPFKVDKNTVFAHNGVLDCVEPTDKKSDTRVFNEVVLKNLKKGFLAKDDVREFLGEIIGSDKLVFLTNNEDLDKNTYIINEQNGKWEDGIWFSNNTYCQWKFTNSYVSRDSSVSNTNLNKPLIYGSAEYNDYIDSLEYDYYNYNYIPNDEFEDPRIGASLLQEVIMEYGSLNAYFKSYQDYEHEQKLEHIVQTKGNKNNTMVIFGDDTDDTIALFSKEDGYAKIKWINEDIKKLIKRMIATFDSSITFNWKDMTMSDWSNLFNDCFGYKLPTLIVKNKTEQSKIPF
tara:strand:- start:3709 stop:4845 length:1137 start_codon:yes stop_codon:yes gene_type:complete